MHTALLFSTISLSLLLALPPTHARFGQENAVQALISAIGGTDGVAATLAGQSIGTLLAGANACAKLTLADQVAALPGTGALDAAKALVQAEKNFNPFAVTVPSFCSDAGLPATAALRGILPLVDPALDGAAAQNAASAASLGAPVDAGGLSVADIVQAQGSISAFTAQAADGGVVDVGGAGAGAAAGANGNAAGGDNAANDTANGGANTGNNNSNNNNNNNNNNNDAAADATTNTGAATSSNLQTFTSADPITFSGNADRPFEVGGSTFVNFAAAAARSCDRQFNACANGANSGDETDVADCTAQKTACADAQAGATVTSFAGTRRGRRWVA